VPEGVVELRPPLKLAWTLPETGASPLVQGGRCFVWSGGQNALICTDGKGREAWRLACRYVAYALLEREVLAVVEIPERTFLRLDQETGRCLLSAPFEHSLVKLLPERRRFIGSTTIELGPSSFRFVVALVEAIAQPVVRWTRQTEHDFEEGPCGVAYDSSLACDGSYVYVRRGSELVALDLETGEDVWAAPLEGLGGASTVGGSSAPVVSSDIVVINTLDGIAALHRSDGRAAWYFPQRGVRMVYGDRVYVVTRDEYCAVELRTGACLLRVPLARNLEKKWRLKHVQFSSHLAVSETHGFIGDLHGRLYAFERDTGEAVWMDRPEGITAFAGSIPVIAGSRLYISGFSMEPAPPPRLYCYEQA
jgi:outer membrane protein assembly factor BamB